MHSSSYFVPTPNLQGVHKLTIDQLSEVKTLYNAKLDEELLISLQEKYPILFEVT